MKPILFNTEMVKAILGGRKTQTRRVCNFHWLTSPVRELPTDQNSRAYKLIFEKSMKLSKYAVGDILYVRETFGFTNSFTNDEDVKYKADDWTSIPKIKWKPCIHMPKKYARLFLKVTSVRVERFKDMSFPDIKKEGVIHSGLIDGMGKWQTLWNSTAPDGYKWEDNPYVFIYEFEKMEKQDVQ